MNNVEQLLYLTGVAAEYRNYSGERTVIPPEVRWQCLGAMGFDVRDDKAVQSANFQLDAAPWQTWLRPFNTAEQGESAFVDVQVHPKELAAQFEWQVTTELGEMISGSLVPQELPEVGNYVIDGVRYSAHRLPLVSLPMGYHRFALSLEGVRLEAIVVIAPSRCYEVDGIGDRKRWGVSCQLYTLRSSRNWGIGDFTDLAELIEHCAAAGMDMIGLNPLHAPQLSGADFASPYSPSDRRFLNPLYIDPQRVPEFGAHPELSGEFATDEFQSKLAGLRALEHVDYDAVAAVKLSMLANMFTYLESAQWPGAAQRLHDLEIYILGEGQPLQEFARHEAHSSDGTLACTDEPRFHQYLQWLASEQLRDCQRLATTLGMEPGLMGDLAVGAVSGGAEVSGRAGLYCTGASIGAPPDPFSSEGQNWNLPALNPVALRGDNYRGFIDLLRANMSHYGALRIDHVMGLMRLWWCMPGVAGGCYVYYPVDTLLALLRLESHRNQCAIIGEDMGVVPEELRQRMSETALYGNKVLYFETDPAGGFKAPRDQQENALLMVTNHDVATLAGWWRGSDLHLRERFGLRGNSTELSSHLDERAVQKQALLQWLAGEGLLPAVSAGADDAPERPFDLALCQAVLCACARSQSRLMLLQLDDLQLIEVPVNIPGTWREYPNWRRKQHRETRALFEDESIERLLSAVRRERAA